MFSAILPLFRHCLLAVLLTCGTAAVPSTASAAPPRPATAGPVLVGFSIYEVVGDRNRLIQASVIFVALGISLLWIGKK